MDKREQVLKELKPLADILNIKIDYVVDEKNRREYLVCNDTKICTNSTSLYGIRQEFMGYLFLREWRERYLGAFDKQTRNYIKQYWYDDNFKQPYIKRRGV